MDELEISGKRYISSKRIAKENKYHPDYMGQLIRAGKISGTKVGRAWYVEEESFANYLGQERAAQPVQASVAPVVESNVVESVAPVATTPDRTPEQSFSAVPENRSESFVQAIPQPVVVEKIFIPQIQEEIKKAEIVPTPTIPVRKPSLTYIPDSSPLFPEIAKRAATQKTIARKEENLPSVRVEIHPQVTQKRSLVKTGAAIMSLGLVAVVVLSAVFFGSLKINSTISVEKGKPASVAFSKNETFCVIFGTCQNN